MKNAKTGTWPINIIPSLFILLFTYTAISKLIDFHKFKIVLITSPLIGNRATIIAWVIPIIELITTLMLLITRTRVSGLYMSFILMVVFTSYVGYMVIFNSNLPCSCGGVVQKMSWRQHLVFNIFFSILSLAGILIYRKQSNRKYES